MVTKENLRYKDSNIYKDVPFIAEPTKYVVTDEDALDPGRICFVFGYPFDFWPILMRYNNIVDPLSLEAGVEIYIPPLQEIQKLELNVNE